MTAYPEVLLFIGGVWTQGESGEMLDVDNPATGETIGRLACASVPDLERAVAAANKGFAAWRKVSPFDRSKVMRQAAYLLRERCDRIARLLTLEQGKPLAEAKLEIMSAADLIDWFAEEGRRTYGRVIPARAEGVRQIVVKEPVGVVAGFTPWNFPVSQLVRKASAALAAGCSIIAKGPEETPASPAELFRCFDDAGVPAGAINMVYGRPADISQYLVPHPDVRKVSFTGSVSVGKQLAGLAGLHMKRITMELGGHSPAIICDDADVESAARALSGAKYRNAGQICVAPTRFLVQEGVYDAFLESFVGHARAIKVGDGMEADTTMGPLANRRRLEAIERLVADAVDKGGKVEAGGRRVGNKGCFFEPTVITGVTPQMAAMNEEPFGPVALVQPFGTLDEAVSEANRLAYGLAAYAWTRSARTANVLGDGLQSGMVTMNHLGLALPEVPFGGVKDSGYGSEGGLEAVEAYLTPKFLTQASL